MNVEDLIEDVTPRLPGGTLTNLWRAQQAVSLLAGMTHEVMQKGQFTADQFAAVASYIEEEMDLILTGIEPLGEV